MRITDIFDPKYKPNQPIGNITLSAIEHNEYKKCFKALNKKDFYSNNVFKSVDKILNSNNPKVICYAILNHPNFIAWIKKYIPQRSLEIIKMLKSYNDNEIVFRVLADSNVRELSPDVSQQIIAKLLKSPNMKILNETCKLVCTRKDKLEPITFNQLLKYSRTYGPTMLSLSTEICGKEATYDQMKIVIDNCRATKNFVTANEMLEYFKTRQKNSSRALKYLYEQTKHAVTMFLSDSDVENCLKFVKNLQNFKIDSKPIDVNPYYEKLLLTALADKPNNNVVLQIAKDTSITEANARLLKEKFFQHVTTSAPFIDMSLQPYVDKNELLDVFGTLADDSITEYYDNFLSLIKNIDERNRAKAKIMITCPNTKQMLMFVKYCKETGDASSLFYFKQFIKHLEPTQQAKINRNAELVELLELAPVNENGKKQKVKPQKISKKEEELNQMSIDDLNDYFGNY